MPGAEVPRCFKPGNRGTRHSGTSTGFFDISICRGPARTEHGRPRSRRRECSRVAGGRAADEQTEEEIAGHRFSIAFRRKRHAKVERAEQRAGVPAREPRDHLKKSILTPPLTPFDLLADTLRFLGAAFFFTGLRFRHDVRPLLCAENN